MPRLRDFTAIGLKRPIAYTCAIVRNDKKRDEIAALLEFVSMNHDSELTISYVSEGVRFLHLFRTVGSQRRIKDEMLKLVQHD